MSMESFHLVLHAEITLIYMYVYESRFVCLLNFICMLPVLYEFLNCIYWSMLIVDVRVFVSEFSVNNWPACSSMLFFVSAKYFKGSKIKFN